jgi:hypothetical protein
MRSTRRSRERLSRGCDAGSRATYDHPWRGTGLVAHPVFKTGRAGQPPAWKVRFLRRVVAEDNACRSGDHRCGDTLPAVREDDLRVLQRLLEDRGDFGHREHVELAWRYLNLYPIDAAAESMSAAIRHLAKLHGAENKYHETITRTWIQFVAVHRERWGAATFEQFLERNPDLLDSKLLEHYYSPAVIAGQTARERWATPDRHRLPALA